MQIMPLKSLVTVIQLYNKVVRDKKSSLQEISALHCYYFDLKPKKIILIFFVISVKWNGPFSVIVCVDSKARNLN